MNNFWKTATPCFPYFEPSTFWNQSQDGFANEADHASRLKAWLSEAETKHVPLKKAGPHIHSLRLVQNVSENVSASIFWHPFLSTIRIDRFFQSRHPSHQCYDMARPPVCWMPICGLWKRSCRPGPAKGSFFLRSWMPPFLTDDMLTRWEVLMEHLQLYTSRWSKIDKTI